MPETDGNYDVRLARTDELDLNPESAVLPSAASPSLAAGAADVVSLPTYTRRTAIYDAHAAFDLVDELEHLTHRSVEPNVFFSPRFLVPAMPRLDDRAVRLMVARDEDGARSRLRFLMPFSVERTSRLGGRKAVRAWTHPFGRLGTLPLDRDDPAGTAASLFEALRAPGEDLPDILVLPDLTLDGAMARVMTRAAQARALPVLVTDESDRAVLDATGDPLDFLVRTLGAKGYRDHRRRLRRLGTAGDVTFTVAQDPAETRDALEDFLLLEASGWKGRARSALLADRHRVAFAREAVDGLARQDRVRIYTLRVEGRAVASLVVLVCEGEATAWKTAYDETHRRAGPGSLVAALASEAMVADPAIRRLDSCAMPDHRIANRLWKGRVRVGTLVIGLTPDTEHRVRQIAGDLAQSRRRLQRRRLWRARVARLLRRT